MAYDFLLQMLPTPTKFHYIFNLRDLSRIWQGILTVTAEVCQSTSVLVALFQHECKRVIADRFTSQNDRDWFEDMMKKVRQIIFSIPLEGSKRNISLVTTIYHIYFQIADEEHGEDLLGSNPKELYFVDFLRDAPEPTGDEPEDVELEAPKIYESVPSFDHLAERLQMFMLQYNETIRGAKVDLVFFKVFVSLIVLTLSSQY